MDTNLKAARERYTDLRQEDVALLLGISKSTYQKYEQGQRNPTGEMLIKLSHILGVSVDTILGTDYSAMVGESDFYSDDERRLVDMYRRMSEPDKSVLMRIALALS